MSKIDTDTKISYKEKMEEEYRILCSVCRKYNYRVEYKFDQFFIYTKYEVWCYEIKSGKRILLHGNLLYGKGGIKESGRWHHQKMCGCRSVDDIVKKFMNMKSGNMVDWNSNKLTNKNSTDIKQRTNPLSVFIRFLQNGSVKYGSFFDHKTIAAKLKEPFCHTNNRDR